MGAPAAHDPYLVNPVPLSIFGCSLITIAPFRKVSRSPAIVTRNFFADFTMNRVQFFPGRVAVIHFAILFFGVALAFSGHFSWMKLSMR
jgi:hypothetical protein